MTNATKIDRMLDSADRWFSRVLERALTSPDHSRPPVFPFFRILAFSTVTAAGITGCLWLMWHTLGW